VIHFRNDDLGYLTWMSAHPNGFVLNVRCPSDPHCVILHRANCKSISNDTYEPNAFTGRNHRKICATSEAELKLAANGEGRRDGTFSKRCGLCRPAPLEGAESLGLLSASADERLFPRPAIRPGVSKRG
jgi:hypothetical protein